jgi:hypothetical protein
MAEELEPDPPPRQRFPEILWGPYQVKHIEKRHGVSKDEFQQAWRSRDLEDDRPGSRHPTRGPSTKSHGFTSADRLLKLRWRYQNQDPKQGVFPLTAFTPGRPGRYTGLETKEYEPPDERKTRSEKWAGRAKERPAKRPGRRRKVDDVE